MFPKWHIIFGAVFSLLVLIIFPSIGLGALIIFLSSVLIDFDHYTSYIFQKKSFSLKKAFEWHARELYIKDKIHPFLFLHFFEVLIIIFLASLKFHFLLLVLLGFLFHILLDITKELKKNLFRPEKYSLIIYIIKA